MFSSTMTKKRSAHGGNRTIFLEVAERDILAPIKRDAMVVVKTLLCCVLYAEAGNENEDKFHSKIN